jgi:D-psicose/D-tagatose/L-ribulose 3-epimerase
MHFSGSRKGQEMSNCSRRDFIKISGNISGAVVLGGLTFSCRRKEMPTYSRWSGFKYAMCNESMAELSWTEQCRIVGNAGYKGIEIAVFTLVREGVQEISPKKRNQMVSVMKEAGLECAGLHWLLAPPPEGLHFTTPDAAVRRKTTDYLDKLIDFCGDLGGPCMVFGSPNQRGTRGISAEEAKKYFAEGLAKLADHARQRDVKILVEHLPKYATDVINTLEEALEVARQINHPAIQIVFDFHNTEDETEPFNVLLRKYYDNIEHVHIQEMDGKHLGTGTAVHDYVKAFQTLKDLKYDKWISLEVFDFSPGGRKIAEESMRTLKEIEAQLL